MDINKKEYQDKIIRAIPRRPHGRLHILPRIGKTRIIIEVIKRERFQSILWVTPSRTLADEDIPKEFKTWGAEEYLSKLTTTTYRSFNKKVGHYDLIVLDEEQCVTINNTKSIRSGAISFNCILAMTGTPSKSFIKNQIYHSLKLNIIYETDLKDAVNNEIISDYEIVAVELELDDNKSIEIKTKTGSFKTSEKDQYDYYNNLAEEEIDRGRYTGWNVLKRARLIYDSPTKLKEAKRLLKDLEGSKIVFCSSIKQAEEISKYTYHSKTTDKYLKKFNQNKIDTLTMVNSGGVGHTFRNVDHVILVQTSNNFNGDSVQKIFRGLLKEGDKKSRIWVLYIKDTVDHRWARRTLQMFSKEKIKILRNGEIQEQEIK